MNIKSNKTKGEGNERVSFNVGGSGAAMATGIMDIVGRGAGVSFYRTRDGSAIGITFMWGDLKEREFVPSVERAVEVLDDIVKQMDEMGRPPEIDAQATKRRVTARTGA